MTRRAKHTKGQFEMQHDVHLAAADRVAEFQAKLADLAQRKAAVATMLADANATVAATKAKQAELAVALAAGNTPKSDVVVACHRAVNEAEASAALATQAQETLDDEEALTTAMLQRSERLKGIDDKKALHANIYDLAVKLDEAAAFFNSAYEAWKQATEDAHYFTIPHADPLFASSGATRPWPNVGPGHVGAASLHPEILRALVDVGFPPNTKSVAKPRLS
jgi:hypothetical protein